MCEVGCCCVQAGQEKETRFFVFLVAFDATTVRLGMSLRGCCPLSRGAEAFIEAHLQRVRLLRAQSRYGMCSSVYVYFCVHPCTCFFSLYLCMCILCSSVYVFFCVHLCMCIMCSFAYLLICSSMHMCNVFICVCVFMCLSMYAYYVFICVPLYSFIDAYVSCVYLCMCFHVFVSVSIFVKSHASGL